MRELSIAGRRIADDTGCFVIAEIGNNHQGSLEKAKELFQAARDAGVDAVKLQKRSNRRLYTRALYESPYDNEQSFGATYGEHREALELDADAFRELRDHAAELGLVFFATAFDEESADLLEALDLPAYKIASGDLRNTPLLRHVASFGKPMIVSTGGATLEDVDRAVETIVPLNPAVCLLQCTAAYPAAVEELELGVIETFRARYPELVIGLSDHQDGIAMSLVAYMLGARVVEKHFTLSHTAKGTDHAFSLMPEGMRKLVRDLERVPAAIGDGVKRPLPTEAKPLEKMGKKLVAARGLAAGHVLAEGRPDREVAGRRRSAALRARRAARADAAARPRRGRDAARRGRRAGRDRPARRVRRRSVVTQPPDDVLREIGLVVFDFDGVFTDNRVWVNERGEESVACWRGDGIGLRRLDEVGVPYVIVSTEPNAVVARRAEKLRARCVHGVDDKLGVVRAEADAAGVPLERVAYVGNDVNDAACLEAVGLPVVPADAWPEVVPLARWVLERPGGHGCVRELCDAVWRATKTELGSPTACAERQRSRTRSG